MAKISPGFLSEKDFIFKCLCIIGQGICKNAKDPTHSWETLKSHSLSCDSCRNAFARYLRSAGILISGETT